VETSKEMCSEDRKAISNNTDNCPKITGEPRYKNIQHVRVSASQKTGKITTVQFS